LMMISFVVNSVNLIVLWGKSEHCYSSICILSRCGPESFQLRKQFADALSYSLFLPCRVPLFMTGLVASHVEFFPLLDNSGFSTIGVNTYFGGEEPSSKSGPHP